jgi:hypothetical protein
MAPCLRAADLFFPLVKRGPIPTTVLEAMAYGVVVAPLEAGCVEGADLWGRERRHRSPR